MASASNSGEDIEVSWQDQQKINLFGRLNLQRQDLLVRLQQEKDRLEKSEDASTEVELLEDEDEGCCWLSVGEVFVNVSPETITDFLDKSTEGSQRLIQEFQKNLDSIDTQMKELKSSLYARFGSNINLETSMA